MEEVRLLQCLVRTNVRESKLFMGQQRSQFHLVREYAWEVVELVVGAEKTSSQV